MTITYANATAPATVENRTWTAAQRSTPAGTLTALAASPTVKVQAPLQTSPFSVNTDADHDPDGCALAPGDCTLREAILAANATSGEPLPVSFIGTAPLTIQPTSPLPVITKGIVIDGITPPANLPNTPSPCTTATPRVTIDGSLAGASASGLELGAGSNGSTIRGLTVTRFGGSGIVVTGSGSHIIQCNTLSADGIGLDFRAGANGSRAGADLSLVIPKLADANAVTANTGAGIRVVGTASGENIAGNRISGNGGLGIDLLPTGSSSDGVTANDALDADTGGNNLQNAPVVFAAEPVSAGTLVSGGLKSRLSKTYLVTFYASDNCDPSGFGQGADIVGSTSVTTGGTSDPAGIPAGEAMFSTTVASVAAGRFVTATATDVVTGDTSELSNCAVSGPDNTVWPKASDLTFDGGGNASTTGYIEASDKSRWYRFPIAPNGKVDISLSGPNGGALPANYDLVLSSDIKAKYLSQTGKPATLGSLTDQAAETPNDAINSSQFSTSALEPTTIDPSLNKPQSAGSAYFGSAYFGSAYFGSAYFGSAYFGSAYFGSAYFGSAYFGSAYFGSAYFGSAYFGSAYFGSAYFGSAYFDPQVFSSAQATSVIGLSANASTTSEHLSVDTWNNTGYLYARVVGPGGARSSTPFTLTIKDNGSACAGVGAPSTPVPVTADAGDYDTLILTDTRRIAPTVMSSLNALATDPTVKGKVVDVDGFQQIRDLNAQADGKKGCVYAKNLVANAIKQVVTAYRAANPGLKYVVIGGGDDVIPFFRTPDRTQIGHESTYFPPVTDTSASQASLRLGYVLSQDGYGSATDLQIKGASIRDARPLGRSARRDSVRDRGHGRRLPHPSGGASAPAPTSDSSLVTGYDFLQDGADDVGQDAERRHAGTPAP